MRSLARSPATCVSTSLYDFTICTALGLAKKTLNKYYEQMDDSELYRIAMGESSCLR